MAWQMMSLPGRGPSRGPGYGRRAVAVALFCMALTGMALTCGAAGLALAASGPVKSVLAAPVPTTPVVPVPGMVTMVDLGATYCVPCRLMEPILKEAEQEYKGRAAVVFVDVTKHEALATRLGIRVIPTQIFYDKSGREVARHSGFMDKKAIAAQLNKMLAK